MKAWDLIQFYYESCAVCQLYIFTQIKINHRGIVNVILA